MTLPGVPDPLAGFAILAAASFVAAAVNSVAGGGTILTFPVLAAILPAEAGRLVTANATSTIGLVPGALSAAWAYRDDRAAATGAQRALARSLLLPSVAGAVVGALLVVVLPPAWFDAAVPWLILAAAILFALQPWLVKAGQIANPRGTAAAETTASLPLAWMLQFLVAVYGGYFGAGIGILMLAVLGLLGLGDIHRLNGVTNGLGTAINGVAAATFAAGSLSGAHDVSWPLAAVMAAAAMAGSLSASVIARRLPPAAVRRFVAILGFALAAYYLVRHFS